MITNPRASAELPTVRAIRWGRAIALLLAAGARAASGQGGDLKETSFDTYAAESTYGELARRLMSPAEAGQFRQRLEAAGASTASQPLDLATEKFLLYVPARLPEQGYALLVFVPPWPQAKLPPNWAPVLDKHGVIFVSAARSGNEENAMARREPLALLAARNVMQRYKVDPQRVFVGGFSGGSRVALRLALGYPDLFRGVLLNAGSDAVGDEAAVPPIPLPPRELLYRFQEGSRLVYATGERDTDHSADDRSSVRSMARWCMFNVKQFEIPRLDHSVADAVALERALQFLLAPATADRQRIDRCRASIDAELEGQFLKRNTLDAAGQRAAAQRLQARIERDYGNLAVPPAGEPPAPR